MSLFRRQMRHLSHLPPLARFAFVRDSSTGQAAVLAGTVLRNPGPLGGVEVSVRLPGARVTHTGQRTEQTEWSGLVYVMPLDGTKEIVVWTAGSSTH